MGNYGRTFHFWNSFLYNYLQSKIEKVWNFVQFRKFEKNLVASKSNVNVNFVANSHRFDWPMLVLFDLNQGRRRKNHSPLSYKV